VSIPPERTLVLYLYTLAIFLGAFLLFLVQPMAGKAILPVLGGSPAVWNTCMVFFQAALLAGYAYAHALSRARRPAVWVAVHGIVIALPILMLGRAVPVNPGAPPVDNPAFWLLWLLATSVGPFFLVLATTGPLMQRWFAATDDRRAADPYFLYAASNAGSLLALLAYPVVIEPFLTLGEQARAFSIGYIAFVFVIIAAGLAMLRRRPAAEPARAAQASTAPEPKLTAQQRLLWVALAFVPSSLMLGVTHYLSTDLAAVPLLWIVPLAIYLLTFIMAYAGRQLLSIRWASILLPLFVLAIVGTMAASLRRPLPLLVGLHLGALFFAALVCHRRLALARPGASGLTQYYLLIAAGGALGGVFNALIAPVVFNSIVEYPIALILACLMALPLGAWGPALDRTRLAAILLVILPAGIAGVGLQALDLTSTNPWVGWIWVGVPLAACALLIPRPRLLASGLALLMAVTALRPDPWGEVLFVDRTFFGVVRVYHSTNKRWHQMFHGTTRHGVQATEPTLRGVPTMYYHPNSPIGEFIGSRWEDPGFERCAIVGLGVGTLAAYGRPGQEYTFYEIDPIVAAIASAPDLFTYLSDSQASIRIELGDARLRLAEAPEAYFDLIVLDAFSSDAIPVHLITREALEMYMARTRSRGVVAFHLSNRYLDLLPVVSAAARDLGLTVVTRTDVPVDDQQTVGISASVWMLVARGEEGIEGLKALDTWYRYEAAPKWKAWTDDYSNVLGAFRW
jgi:hypothetical protein